MSNNPAAPDAPPPRGGVSRRGALGLLGAGALGVAAGVAIPRGDDEPARAVESVIRQRYSPHETHQAGIVTPVPAATELVAVDLRKGVDADGLGRLLRLWSGDIAKLMGGEPVTGDRLPDLAEAGQSLSITVGFGPGVFALPGLAGKAPAGFMEIPPMRHDKLRDSFTGGDLMLLVSADDATTVTYAVETLLRDGRTFVTPRWVQPASWRGVGPDGAAVTGRNLFGQLDGSANPKPPLLDPAVWASDGPEWFLGGTQMVVRRIEMDLQEWNTLTRNEQEQALGRDFASGAPLSGGDEHTAPDFSVRDADGRKLVRDTSHVAMAHPSNNNGRRMLRRSMNYTHTETVDGVTRRSSGLLFIAFVANIAQQFVPVQQRLDGGDEFNRWTTAIGSAVFAVPPGFPRGDWLGSKLFG